MARLLEKYEEMQRRPFGTNTALSAGNERGVGGSAGFQSRQQGAAYGRALRILNRQARRGDANSALQAIRVRDDANSAGYSPGGIGNPVERDAGITSRLRAQSQAAADNEMLQQVNRQSAQESLNAGRPSAGRPDAGRPMAGRPDGGSRLRSGNGIPTMLQRTDDSYSTFSTPENRNYAALDLLEGSGNTGLYQDGAQQDRGYAAATQLGVGNPNSIFSGDSTLRYRNTLDSTLGAATSPEEISALRSRGLASGISPQAFDRRAKWWERNRR